VGPTIFDHVDNASRLGQEEIFGPVVAVTTFRDEAEAVELANAVDFGLVAGVWSGYKQSGMGRELGFHGLNDFIEIKQIFTDGTALAMKPPYGQVIKE
jgi:acyl-CoA reductase-like NAD-dependent aldehyde dehydrogenase